MEGLTLTTREQARIQVSNGVTAGEVTVVLAAGLMKISERHAWRMRLRTVCRSFSESATAMQALVWLK